MMLRFGFALSLEAAFSEVCAVPHRDRWQAESKAAEAQETQPEQAASGFDFRISSLSWVFALQLRYSGRGLTWTVDVRGGSL